MQLSGDDLERKFVISRLLCRGEIRADEFRRQFRASFRERFAPTLQRLEVMEKDGLVHSAADGSLRLSLAGRVLGRNVAAVFDAYLPEGDAVGAPRFSQSV